MLDFTREGGTGGNQHGNPEGSAISKIEPATTCAHSRLIEDVLTRSGKRTGNVRCLECGATFDDPHPGNR